MGKNIIIFGGTMSSSVHINNKNKDILILSEALKQGLDDTTLTADTYPVNFVQSGKRFVLSLHYNWSNSLYQNISIQSKRLWNRRLYTVFR